MRELNFVLWNGREFWAGPGRSTRLLPLARVIAEGDALAWVSSCRVVEPGAFYPVALVAGERKGERKGERGSIAGTWLSAKARVPMAPGMAPRKVESGKGDLR